MKLFNYCVWGQRGELIQNIEYIHMYVEWFFFSFRVLV